MPIYLGGVCDSLACVLQPSNILIQSMWEREIDWVYFNERAKSILNVPTTTNSSPQKWIRFTVKNFFESLLAADCSGGDLTTSRKRAFILQLWILTHCTMCCCCCYSPPLLRLLHIFMHFSFISLSHSLTYSFGLLQPAPGASCINPHASSALSGTLTLFLSFLPSSTSMKLFMMVQLTIYNWAQTREGDGGEVVVVGCEGFRR